jgi:hypothetical protein
LHEARELLLAQDAVAFELRAIFNNGGEAGIARDNPVANGE